MVCGKVRIFQPEIRRWTCFVFLFCHVHLLLILFVSAGDIIVYVSLLLWELLGGGVDSTGLSHQGGQVKRGGKRNFLKSF